jgi:four helix bundle protein
LRRASYSIPSNLAEGTGKLTDLDFRRFVSIAFGRVNELEYFLFLSYSLNYISNDEYVKLDAQSNEVKRMLLGLINRLSKRIVTSVFFISIIFLGSLFLLAE